MAATMNCPGCQTPLRVREDMAGKKIKCPRCAQVITVPEDEPEMLEEAAPAERITAEPAEAKPRREKAATRPCPSCGESIAQSAQWCRHCRADFRDDEEDEDDEEDRPIRRRSRYQPCPRCGASGAERVVWTPWGSFYGPALFTHVRCPECRYAYNGKNGRSNLIPAIIFMTIPAVLILLILCFIGWMIFSRVLAQ